MSRPVSGNHSKPLPILYGDKADCCGCSACKSVCAENAITMHADEEGFLYPVIDAQKCIRCGRCLLVCPFRSHQDTGRNQEIREIEAYAAYNTNPDVRAASSSGGVFFSVASAILEDGGVVCGAGFDRQFRVRHAFAENIQELGPLLGSKYVQSDTGSSFQKIFDTLQAGRKVLFAGTPCQVKGLKLFIGDHPLLYTVDLACHGVPSPMLWERYVNAMSQKKKVAGVNFRDKKKGWNGFSLSFRYHDGSSRIKPRWREPYMKCFLRDLSLRPSCYHCAVKGVKRVSDITLADLWGVETVVPDLADNRGISLVLLQSEKGKCIFNHTRQRLICMPADLENALVHNRYIRTSVPENPKRQVFFSGINIAEQNIIPYMQKATPISPRRYFEHVKSILYKTISPLLRKLKRTAG